VAEAERSSVSALHAANDKLTWTQLDQADPLPLEMNDTMTQFLVRISGLDSLDEEMLRVEGLTAPEYTLAIDGQVGWIVQPRRAGSRREPRGASDADRAGGEGD
jgi:hypothetical protein